MSFLSILSRGLLLRTLLSQSPTSVLLPSVLGANRRRLSSVQKLRKTFFSDGRMERREHSLREHSLPVRTARGRGSFIAFSTAGEGAGFSQRTCKRAAHAEDPRADRSVSARLAAAILDWGVVRRASRAARQLRRQVPPFCRRNPGLKWRARGLCMQHNGKKGQTSLPRFYFYSPGMNGLCW